MKSQKTHPKIPFSIKIVLGESSYKGDQAISNTSLEYDEFELSCDEYVEIFNKLMRLGRVTQCFDVLPKVFNNSYTIMKRGVDMAASAQ